MGTYCGGDRGWGSIPGINLQTCLDPKIPGLESSAVGSEKQPKESVVQSSSPDKEIIDFTSSPKKDSLILLLTLGAAVEDANEDPPED